MEINSTSRADIAIIGMACVFPKAPDLDSFWQNIVSRVDGIADPPGDSLANRVFEPEAEVNDRIYCKRGGYLKTLPPFKYTDYGVMPVAIDGAEPEHFMALKVAGDALADAGFPEKPFNRERTEVILGRGTFVNRGYMTVMQHGIVIDQTLRILKQLHSEYSAEDLAYLKDSLKANLPPFTPETAPGLCHNVMAGMIANRLDLKGRTMVLDAACASSMLALEIGMDDLLKGKCDAVIIGGVQISTDAPIHMIFTQLGALSRLPHLRPFDKDADGTMLGEGIGMMVLKRREDAVRDGHRIYAVVKAVGSSSDGQGKGLLAPRIEGEELAVRRAYEAADIDPKTIELVEAHGTAIPLGDATEIEALRRVFGSRNSDLPRCAIGTVKSMIGHLIPAAGVAGMIKAALAVYHQILPPTLYCDQPNPALEIEKTPFYINTRTRPWIHGISTYPRRAGVSSFGFGGINAHVILEENAAGSEVRTAHHHQDWETELCVVQGATRADLIRACENLHRAVSASEPARLLDMTRAQNTGLDDRADRLCIVADSPDDLGKKLQHAIERLKDPKRVRIKDKSGIYFFDKPLGRDGKLAFLFPGEGSQYVNMLADICLHFAEARSCFDLLDCAYADHPRNYRPSDFIFPPSDDIRAQAEAQIWEMDSAVDAVTTANRALLKVVGLFGIAPDAVLGHSSGEMAALEAAGAVELDSEQEVIHHIRAGNGVIEALEAADDIPQGQLLAVGGVDLETVSGIIENSDDFLTLAMDNCPHQFVLCGTEKSIDPLTQKLKKLGGICQQLPFKRAYHTRRFEPALDHLERFFHGATFVAPQIPLYSCMTAGLYPSDPKAVLRYALDQWARPVKFRQTVEAMHRDGIRIFLELGPRGNLTAFVNDILKGKSFVAVPANVHHRSGITQLNHALALLAAHGVPLNLNALYRHRRAGKINPAGHSDSDSQSSKGSVQLSLALPMLNLDTFNPDGLQKNSQTGGAENRHTQNRSKHSMLSESMQTATAPAGGVSPELSAPDFKTPAGSLAHEGRGAPPGDVMQEYFNTMDLFMDMQQQVMEAYLGLPGSADSKGVAIGGIRQQAPAPPADVGSTRPPLSDEDQGLSPQDQFNDPAGSGGRNQTAGIDPNQAATAPADRPFYDEKHIQDLLLECVSDKTGYPLDMLTPDQNLEADLGIDSIKRVEIMGTLSRQLDFLEQLQADELKDLKTIAQIANFLATRLADHVQSGKGPAGNRTENFQETIQPHADPLPEVDLPFAGEVVREVPGREVTVKRQLDMDRDLFLRHHTLGGSVSKYDDTLLALPIVPFSISSEIMAQVAAQLFPGKFLLGMKDLKAHDWIALEERQLTLQIIAAAHSGLSEARTELYIANPSGSQSGARLVMEGIIIFGDTYPQAPAAERFDPGTELGELMPPDQFYPSAMFHGPSFRCVNALHRCGDRGLETSLVTPPKDLLFAGESNPRFLSDPILLDGAGQTVGLWAAHCLDIDFVVFPVELSEVRFYKAPSQDSTSTSCRVWTELDGDDFIRSHIDLAKSDGVQISQLRGLRHKRIHMPEILHRFRGSREIHLSETWQTPLEKLAAADKMICCRLNPAGMDFSGRDGRILRAVIAHIVLSRQERKIWNGRSGSETQRTQWLLSRVVAKEAVCQLLERLTGNPVWPADIEIQEDSDGDLQVSGQGIGQMADAPLLSLDRVASFLVALAADAEGRSGVGIAARRDGPFDKELQETSFKSKEIELISSSSKAESGEWLHRMRCAKKALAKAVGRDLLSDLNHINVQQLDIESGNISLELSGNAARRFPKLKNKHIQAHTQRHEDLIIAIVVYTE